MLGKYDQDNANASLSHTTSPAYDPTHRLTAAVATGSSTYDLAFAYDQFGNMTCQTNGQTQGYCPPFSFSSSTNQITNSGYVYDASGDLTSDGTYTYKYDAEGRLVSVDNGSTASYVYNALGERVEKDLSGIYTEYAFDRGGNPEAENNRGSSNGGWVDSWVNFEGQHLAHYENNGVYYIYSNQVGTAGVVTDWTGAVLQDELHYPWGKVWTTMGTQTEERFASLHHRDAATNLDPTHFRMYSSDEARWLTPDPAQADIYNPQSMSRYAYALNSPTTAGDPLGLDSVSCSGSLPGFTTPNFTFDYTCYDINSTPPDASSWSDPSTTLNPLASANTWLGQNTGIYNPGTGMVVPGTGSVSSSCAPSGGLGNSCSPGYTGGTQMNLGFTYAVNQTGVDFGIDALGNALQLLNNPFSSAPIYNILNDFNALNNLKAWNSWASSSVPSAPKPSAACSKVAPAAMSQWNSTLQAWLRTHPGQTPPAYLTTSPNLSCGM